MKNNKLQTKKKTHTISVLFTSYTDFASKIVYFVSGRGYTHVSLSLDDKNEYFYAFNTKGFRKEYPRKHKNRTKENICYKLEITHKQFKKLSKMIKEYEEKKHKLSYNWIGLFSSMVHIPIKMKNRYFCSQFIANLLEKAEIIKWKHNYSRYLPNQLNKEFLLCPLIKSFQKNCFEENE